MQERPTGLHPFSRRVAFGCGGLSLAAAVAGLVWARTRVPDDEELARRVAVVFGLPGEPGIQGPGRAAAGRPLEVRVRHDLPRPIGLVVVARGAAGEVRWLVPTAPEGKPQVLAGADKPRLVALPVLPAGQWRVDALVGVELDAADQWLARQDRGERPPLVFSTDVTVVPLPRD